MQIIDSIETYAYKTNADVKKMKLNVTKKKNSFNDVTKGNIKEHNPKWP